MWFQMAEPAIHKLQEAHHGRDFATQIIDGACPQAKGRPGGTWPLYRRLFRWHAGETKAEIPEVMDQGKDQEEGIR